MKKGLWIVVTVVALFLGFLLGYSISGYAGLADDDDDDDGDARIGRSLKYSITSIYKGM